MWQKLILRVSVLAVALSLAFPIVTAPAQEQTAAFGDKSVPLEFFLARSKACRALTPEEIKTAEQEIAAGKRQIPEEIQKHRAAWLDYSLYFRHMYYVISIAIIVFGALATALQDDAAWYRRWKTTAAVLATIAAGANTTLAPYADFKKFDQAFVVLNTVRAQYLTNPLISLCDVGNAVAYGEAIIHRGE